MAQQVEHVAVREVMTEYWQEHSKEASVEEMMLDTKAEELCVDEHPEVMGMLPAFKERNVLELGAGIGRFTKSLATEAKHVLAVDFVESFLQKNKESNSNFDNIEYKTADVTKLSLTPEKFDLIFSNWLMMYLSDEEVQNLAKSMLEWCSEDGFLFFRESCFHQSGDKKRSSNPSYYRTPAMYNAFFQSVHCPTSDGDGSYVFELVFSRPIQAYVKHKNSINQICWMFKKTHQQGSFHGYKTFQEFLDNQQYSENGIKKYEKIFGRNFISTGGKDTTEEFVKLLELKPGKIVLDVGSGIGGSAFYMAEKHDVSVLGIDLSSNMVSISLERANEISDTRVQFEVADATKRDFSEKQFDVIYSRDTILHIEDKEALFSNFLKWLKPGGKLLISDYCCSDGNHSDIFKAYVQQRGYHLLSPAKYGEVLESVGFVNVKAQDKTEMFMDVLQKELDRIATIQEEFIQEFSEEDYNDIVDGWKEKHKRCRMGNQKWGLFYAEKSQ